jgi:2-C-methyl-D-erythritol 4-phosphate cytidylyltransferase
VSARDVGVIIVAAGSSTRTQGDELKQFRWIGGKPMLLHSVQTFQERTDVAMVIVVLPKKYAGDPPPWLFQCDLERMLVSVGGRQRSDSVRNGLEDLTESAGIVAVHDAARPFASAALIDRVITEARKGHGAAPGIPVVDTLKRAGDDGNIVETVSRDGLWRIQTPQAFPRDMLETAYADAYDAGVSATDDASLCERLGLPVVLVPGSERAMKISTDSDFAQAEALSILPE